MKTIEELRSEASLLRLLYLLISSGIPVLRALELAGNRFSKFSGALSKAHQEFSNFKAWYGAVQSIAEIFSYFVPSLLASSAYRSDRENLIAEGLWRSTLLVDKTRRLVQAGATKDECHRVQFFAILGDLITLGCPILEAIELAGSEYLGRDERTAIVRKIKGGETQVLAFASCPRVFEPADIALISVADSQGSMSATAGQISWIREQQLLMAAKQSFQSLSREDHVEEMVSYEFLSTLGTDGRVAFTMVAGDDRTVGCRTFRPLQSKIAKGMKWSDAMATTSGFEFHVVELVRLGENEERLDEVFGRIAEYIRWEHLDAPMPLYSVEVLV